MSAEPGAGPDPMTPPTFDLDAVFEDGVERLRSVVGDRPADELLALAARAERSGDAARAKLPAALTWGWLLNRPGLSARERAIAVISVDVARGARRALRDHYLLALSEGVTPAELRELLLQLGPFAGYPSTNEATAVLGDLLAERAAPDPVDAVSSGSRRGWLDRQAEMDQCTIVVPDARVAAEHLGILFGMRHWQVFRLDQDSLRMSFAGAYEPYAMLRAVATSPGGFRVELLQPIGASALSIRLLTRGAYVESLAVALMTEVGLDDLLTVAASAGVVPARTVTSPDGSRLVVLDTRDLLGGYHLTVGTCGPTDLDELLPVDETWEVDIDPDATLFADRPLDHVGMVVRDIEARSSSHARVFGAGRWPVNHFSSADGTLTDVCLQGHASSESYLSSVARVGTFAIELCQPLDGPSHYREGFLDPCGEGVQHLFFGAWSEEREWDRAVAALLRRGLDVVNEGRAWDGGVRYGYVGTRALVGFDLEIAVIDPALRLDVRARAAAVLEHPTSPSDPPSPSQRRTRGT